tara:strand:+ start:2228 stop:3070 length:843 start_codon:yes stop_codon:yes gene_type:complete
MEINELLDRFEILYPTNESISDLRRAYTDKDLRSLFRIVNDSNKDNLRKLIMEDNKWKLWPLLDECIETQFTKAFKSFFVNDTEIWNDCFSRGQLQSKLWLVEELEKLDLKLGTVFLCAGWYATLATMLFESDIKVDKVRSFDIDETCVDIAETFNKPWFVDEWRFKSITQDIMNIDYNKHVWQCWSTANDRMSRPITDVPNTIVNTSCEHIENFKEWYAKIPKGKLVILQNNNYVDIKEHVNCVSNTDEFIKQAPMSELMYSGTALLPKYKRFMLIGRV